jgi:predicted Zn-dependent protease
MKILHLFAVINLAFIFMTGCTNSPMGRQQILLFSGNEMSKLGAQSFEQMKLQEKISKDVNTNRYVQCVSNAITDTLGPQPDFKEWEVVVFDSDQVNAFALPGGKIGVYTGLLKVAKNQHQLATVIGHEITHVTANHSNERLSNSKLTSIGLDISNIALEGNEYKSLTMAGLGLGVQYGVIMPYGRAQESESDIIGLKLMARAGFDPKESVALWENMAKASGGHQPPELLSTHPSHSNRIDDLNTAILSLAVNNVAPPKCSR